LPEWSKVVHESADAWFWHTRTWLEFVAEVGREYFVDDLSFMIARDNSIVAVCPLILEARGGYRRFSYLGEYIPFPAFVDDLPDTERSALIEFYVAEIERLAAEREVGYTRIAVPVLTRRRLAPAVPTLNPLVRFGFAELTWMTQVIDLTCAEHHLWHGLRKGHRSDVKRARQDLEVIFWDRECLTPEKFAEYEALHAKDAGRVTRSKRSFDMMQDWVREGHAVLVEASRAGRPVAFALLLLFGAGAYYGSSCKDPECASLAASHVIQWESMRWLKARGYCAYDIGVQHFGSQIHHIATEKDLGIASFKRGFGGRTVPVPTVERFFSNRLFEEQARRRLASYLAAIGSS